MAKIRTSPILNEKDHISSHLNTVNDGTAKQKSYSPRKSQIKVVHTSPFSPTDKKTRKKHLSQSNTIDGWLGRKGEENDCKVSTKSSKPPRTCSDKLEKENQNNADKQIEIEKNKLRAKPSKSCMENTPLDTISQTETDRTTKHNLKVTSQHSIKERKETASSSNGSSKKKSERESKNAKVESQSRQRKLDTYLNNEDKQNKWKRDNKNSQPSTSWSSSHNTTRREDSHKESFNNSQDKQTKHKGDKELQPSNRSSSKKEDGHRGSSSNNKDTQSKHKGDNRKLQPSTSCSSNRSTIKKEESNNKEQPRKSDSSKTDVEKKHKQIRHLDDKRMDNKSSSAIKKDSVWLSKDGGSKDRYKDRSRTKYDELPVKISSNKSPRNLVERDNKSKKRSRSKTSSIRNSSDKQESVEKKNKSSAKRNRSKTPQGQDIKLPFKAQEKLDKFLIKHLKPDNKRKFTRTDSNESCELPSFKTKKAKKHKKDELFKKYGMSIPSVEEILKEQKDLEKYKEKIQSFQEIENKFFELPFSVKDLNRTQEASGDVLDCKHLSMDEITAAFENNLKHISAIFHGKLFNERHERYFNNTNNYALTVKDLCYNTSMIVFNFDQKEHMITLLKNEFDPDDKWTPYFFQVLLPELCMKIFMDAHKMAYDEAVKYLDTRPIIDD